MKPISEAISTRPGADPRLPSGWAGLGTALGAVPVFKTVGISLFTAAVMAGYFWILHHPGQAVVVMPVTFLDRWIPFSPVFGPAYYSLWFYLSLCAGFIPSSRQLWVYGAYAGVIGLLSLLVFLLWPTAVPNPGIDWGRYPSLAFMKHVDASGNACPSLHVAYAVYSAVWIDRFFGELKVRFWLRALNLLWAGAIIYSTVAVRQHVVIDVLLGMVLGGAGAFAFLRARRALTA